MSFPTFFTRANAAALLCVCASTGLVACSSETEGTSAKKGDATTGGTSTGGSSAGGDGLGGSGSGLGGSRSGLGGSGVAGDGFGGTPGDILDGETDALPGWLDVFTSPGDAEALVSAPIVRCEAVGDQLLVGGDGLDRGGIDRAVIRLQVVSGYHGPGAYDGSYAQGLRVEVFNGNVGGFSLSSIGSCEIRIGQDARSGEFRCRGLIGWTGEGNVADVRGFDYGTFRCDALSTTSSGLAFGEPCTTFGCPVEAPCSSPGVACASGVCARPLDRAGSCSVDCGNEGCPYAMGECMQFAGNPAHVCVLP